MKNKGQEGYALIEFVAALGINAIIAAALFGIFFIIGVVDGTPCGRHDIFLYLDDLHGGLGPYKEFRKLECRGFLLA